MAHTLPIGPYRTLRTVEDLDVPWYVLPFDERGIGTAPLTHRDCLQRVAAEQPTDVFVFCHGWNNDWKYATEERYERFFQGYEQLRREHNLIYPRRYKPLLIGLFWPSAALIFQSERAPQVAGENAPTVAREEDELIGIERQEVAELARDIPSEHLAAFYQLAQSGANWNTDAARALVELLLHRLRREGSRKEPLPTANELLASWSSAQQDIRAEPGEGPATIVRRQRTDDPAPAPFLGLPTPREIVRGFTVWQMKDRAKVIGETAEGPLLNNLLNICDARLHLLGHSYGCQVTLTAICSPAMDGQKRQIDSVLLLQPAISAACFAKEVGSTGEAGKYRPALTRVRQPIFATYSIRDAALHDWYHQFVHRYKDAGDRRPAAIIDYYAALGGYGPKDCDPAEVVQRQELLVPPDFYPRLDDRVRIVGLEGSKHIADHSDICNPATYWALYQQVVEGQIAHSSDRCATATTESLSDAERS